MSFVGQGPYRTGRTMSKHNVCDYDPCKLAPSPFHVHRQSYRTSLHLRWPWKSPALPSSFASPLFLWIWRSTRLVPPPPPCCSHPTTQHSAIIAKKAVFCKKIIAMRVCRPPSIKFMRVCCPIDEMYPTRCRLGHTRGPLFPLGPQLVPPLHRLDSAPSIEWEYPRCDRRLSHLAGVVRMLE